MTRDDQAQETTADVIARDWISESGASATAALAAWDGGELVELPVGKGWDVVRMPRALGWKAITEMHKNGVTVGPAQHAPDGVDVLVPVGSAAAWDLPDTEVLTEGTTVLLPPPAIVAPHTLKAHTWIVSPKDCGPLTDADMLHEAYAAALAALHMGAAG
ncbi:hypothetical protein ABZ656_33825 [Streptomyces sp. NPDC007095]|uniref:hypothetical protein n=1 Tax=Streptomyces sp. NPDC007095 TaxID=3154482 RepID=UPI0033E9A121